MPTSAAAEAFEEALLHDDPAALYDKAPCGYLSTAGDGTITKVNATFMTWTGYAATDLVGRLRLTDLMTLGAKIYHETHVSPILHGTSRVKEIALELVRADGARMPVLVNAVLERSPLGDPRIVRYAIFDATERRRYEQELLLAKQRAEETQARAVRLAQTLQATLMPPISPQVPGLDVATAYRPAGLGEEVGGDFYDVFQVGDGDWVVALGDVSGKGVEAAVITALVRHSVRALAVSERSPRALLHQLNSILLAHESDRFCTVVVMRMHQRGSDWEVTSSAGGHPMPLVLRRGEEPEAFGEPGTFVGAFEEAHYDEATMMLRPGEMLFLHTDGVTEARRDREFFGDSRLLASLITTGTTDTTEAAQTAETADGLVQRVLDEVLDFARQMPRDDIALLALRVPDRRG